MKILVVAPPILKDINDVDSHTTVPPNGYGGVEIVVYSIIYGLIELGLKVSLIGSPGSYSFPGLNIIREPSSVLEIRKWIYDNHVNFDLIHDHSLGMIFDRNEKDRMSFKYLATHHKTGVSSYGMNVVYISKAQRMQAKKSVSPIVRLPVISQNYIYKEDKDDFYLYMGRVDDFKGVYEAAKICKILNSHLIIAGPHWNQDYFDKINTQFGSNITFLGEVSGLKKLRLLSNAKATFVLSKSIEGPWGDVWSEPGATIVAESAVCGTPVISTNNGCLAEIVSKDIGIQIDLMQINDTKYVSSIIQSLPESSKVRSRALSEWGHLTIAKQYLALYKKVINGLRW